MTTRLGRWAPVALAALAALASGCAEAAGGQGSQPQDLGSPCTKSEDCEARLCIQIRPGSGVCTQVCAGDQGCPAAVNWKCLTPDNFSAAVCACRPTGQSEVCGDGLDNDCDGHVDDCISCGGVALPPDDPSNCGACGKECRSDQVCQQGKCACGEQAKECNGKCTDTKDDPDNCGACGAACAQGLACQDGECVCPDPAKPIHCGGACVADDTEQNCGSCGNKCASGSQCQGGKCVCSNTTDTGCPGVGCVDLQSNPNHCGACDAKCTGGQGCQQGECACQGDSPAACSGECVELGKDPKNCGACGHTCGNGQICEQGECTCLVGSLCGNGCYNLQNNPKHCGECGNVCAPGETCASGACTCASDLYCDQACMPEDDPQNCGACANVCGPSQLCASGKCTCSDKLKSPCGQECFSLKTDEANCGACGATCESGQICSSGVCGCPNGSVPCQGSCLDTKTDPANCGACGNACKATEVCSVGVCKCPKSGQKWCNGACLDTITDEANCGACGNVCKATEVCNLGKCICPTFGDKFCDSAGACIDTESNPEHCGACDKACPTATHCVFGDCTCDQQGLSLCEGTCFDLKSDPTHCGSCKTQCGGNFSCITGVCSCPTPQMQDAVRLTNSPVVSYLPRAAFDGVHVGLAYIERKANPNSIQGNVRLALLDPDGSLSPSGDIPVTTFDPNGSEGAISVDVVWNGSEYGLIWVVGSGMPSVAPSLMFRRLAPDGTPKGPAINLTAATPGARVPFGARLAWSPVYGGYAIAGGTAYSGKNFAWFQRIGADGTALDPVNEVSLSTSSDGFSLAVSPAGEWGLLVSGFNLISLLRFNPDGSKTAPTVDLYGYQNNGGEIAHDGKTWVAAWVSYSEILVNRGEQPNGPYSFGQIGASQIAALQMFVDPTGTLDLAWSRGSSSFSLSYQRFLLPTDSSSNVTPLCSELSVLPTPNMDNNGTFAICAAGPGKRLVGWADNRFGPEEIYARSVDSLGCP